MFLARATVATPLNNRNLTQGLLNYTWKVHRPITENDAMIEKITHELWLVNCFTFYCLTFSLNRHFVSIDSHIFHHAT